MDLSFHHFVIWVVEQPDWVHAIMALQIFLSIAVPVYVVFSGERKRNQQCADERIIADLN